MTQNDFLRPVEFSSAAGREQAPVEFKEFTWIRVRPQRQTGDAAYQLERVMECFDHVFPRNAPALFPQSPSRVI